MSFRFVFILFVPVSSEVLHPVSSTSSGQSSSNTTSLIISTKKTPGNRSRFSSLIVPLTRQERFRRTKTAQFPNQTGGLRRWGRPCAHPEGCPALSKKAIYGTGIEGDELRYCKDHRGTEHINLVGRCQFPSCTKQGIFTTPIANATRVRFCKQHCPSGWRDMHNPRCTVAGCTLRASYRPPSSSASPSTPSFCRRHRGPRDVNRHIPRCAFPGCTTSAIFGMPRAYPPPPGPPRGAARQSPTAAAAADCRDSDMRFCAAHRPQGAADLRNPRCQAMLIGWDEIQGRPGVMVCPMRAAAASPDSGRFCAVHRGQGLVRRDAGATAWSFWPPTMKPGP